MPKRIDIHIKESLTELKALRRNVRNHNFKTRIQSLIITKENKLKRRIDVASHFGIGIATLNRWTNTYLTSGLDALLHSNSRGKRRSVVTQEIHDALSIKLQDSKSPLMGYLDAQHWVNEKFNILIKYNTLRTYMKRHFKTKLKSPRKSHYKKDEQAIEAFKKTP